MLIHLHLHADSSPHFFSAALFRSFITLLGKFVAAISLHSRRSRKRSRMQAEEKSSINLNLVAFEPVNVAPAQGSVEETMRNCLTPILKEFIGNFTSGSDFGCCGSKGIGSLVSDAVPMNFPGVNLGDCGNVMDERWRKQLILELEVYSK